MASRHESRVERVEREEAPDEEAAEVERNWPFSGTFRGSSTFPIFTFLNRQKFPHRSPGAHPGGRHRTPAGAGAAASSTSGAGRDRSLGSTVVAQTTRQSGSRADPSSAPCKGWFKVWTSSTDAGGAAHRRRLAGRTGLHRTARPVHRRAGRSGIEPDVRARAALESLMLPLSVQSSYNLPVF